MHRLPRVLLLGCLVAVSVGCVAARNLVADRDLVCRETPDDVCIRVAELALTRLEPAIAEAEPRRGRIPTIEVSPVPCTSDEIGFPVPNATRCWMVMAANETGGVGVNVLENRNGSLEVP